MPIDHEHLVGVIGQRVEAAQIAQHDLERHVLADGDQIEVHARADRLVRVGQRRAQLLALFRREPTAHLLDDVVGQILGQLGEFVGVQRARGRDQLVAVHRCDQRLAHRIGHLDQDLAVALGLDEVPDHQPLVARQRLEDVCDVGRVQPIESGPQVGEVLRDRDLLDQHLPAGLEVLALLAGLLADQPVAAQQVLDVGERALCVLGIARMRIRWRVVQVDDDVTIGIGHGMELGHGAAEVGIDRGIALRRAPIDARISVGGKRAGRTGGSRSRSAQPGRDCGSFG